MPTYTQANQPLEVVTPLGKDVLLITNFRGDEGISRLFSFHVDMLADSAKEIAFDQILGQKIAVRLNMTSGKPRYFCGICRRISQGATDVEVEPKSVFTAYTMEVVPQFWLLTKVSRSRIFQQMSVPDILKKVLQGLDVVYQIQGTFAPRNYCVQYRETDFNFACRLMEEEGICYFFTHTDAGHKMVLANSAQSHPELPLGNKLLFEKSPTSIWRDDRIQSWERAQELLTGQQTLWDHSFEVPGRNLEAKSKIPETLQAGKVTHKLKAGQADARETYDFPGGYALRFDGVNAGGGDQAADVQKIFTDNARTAGIRSQQEAVLGLTIEGTGACRNLVSGHKFNLDRHPNANGDYVLIAVHHETTGGISYRSSGAEALKYVNSFTAIPLAMPFRPQRSTVKPVVQGTQTATVVGPKGEEIFTDKYGRVKVQFNWDRDGKKDAASSCWVRVGQLWAGKRWGASFWPRIGQEVIVAFLEGNPDAPIIVGSVYNAEQMPPYLGDGLDAKHPKDNKVAGVKSNTTPGGQGFNEWRFDDTKGKEQIFIHGERNLDVLIKNDRMESVVNDSHLTVGKSNAGNQNELVYQDKNLNVKGNQIEKIEGNLTLTIGKGDASAGGNVNIVIDQARKESIGGTNELTVTGDRVESVGGGQSLSVGGDQQEKVTGKHLLEAGAEIHIKAGSNLVIEAAQQLTLMVGGNFIVIDASGVSIVGTMVNINSGGSPGSGSPSQPASPGSVPLATPIKPTPADDSKSGQKSAPS